MTPIRYGDKVATLQSSILKAYLGAVQIYPETPAGPVNYTITEESVLEHDTDFCMEPSVVRIADTRFAIAYRGTSSDGYISTFSIDPDNDYAITEIDSLEHDTADGAYNSLVCVGTTRLVLSYSGSGSDGFIKTFSIDANCDNITEIDSLEFDATLAIETSLVKITDTLFAVAYEGTDSDGFICTISTDANGDNLAIVDSLEHDTGSGGDPAMCLLDSTHVALCYQSGVPKGVTRTIAFDANGDNITTIGVNSIISLSVDTQYHAICKVDATHYAIAYTDDTGEDGYIATIEIDGSYYPTIKDTVEYDTSSAYNNSIVLVDAKHLMLAYTSVYNNGPGYVITFGLDASYEITEIDSLKHTDTTIRRCSLCQLDSYIYALAYSGVDTDGFVKTFSID